MLLNTRIPVSYIVGKVKYEIFYILFIAVLIYYITHWYRDVLPEVPLSIPAFMGTAISVLLSFKLNQSYDRWWEARKIWGSIVNDSRSFVVQLQTMIKGGNEGRIKQMAYRQIAWCYSLGQSLRDKDGAKGLDKYINSNDLKELDKHTNKPLALIQMHGKDLAGLQQNGQLELFSQIHIDDTLVRLCESMGKAERIKNTVFPVTYRLFLHFMIYLFIILLSIALRNLEVYFEVPLLFVISIAFFLLEKTASHMQDPFSNMPSDTAMTSIAQNIEVNIRQLLNEEDVPMPEPSNSYYIS